jgi:Holliday junction resolvase RusA-like endonuclease
MTQSTSKLRFRIPVNPVPASRPRVTRWGVYYGKRHTQYVKECAEFFKTFRVIKTFDTPVEVGLSFLVSKPKTTKRLFPIGDVDNYCKLALDELVKWKVLKDDDLVLRLFSDKDFADEGKLVGTYVVINHIG